MTGRREGIRDKWKDKTFKRKKRDRKEKEMERLRGNEEIQFNSIEKTLFVPRGQLKAHRVVSSFTRRIREKTEADVQFRHQRDNIEVRGEIKYK